MVKFKKIKIKNKEYAYLFKIPKDNIANIIFLPGVSGDIFGKKYDYFSRELFKEKFSLFRFNLWDSGKDLDKKTIDEIIYELKFIYNFVKKNNKKPIFFVGKSFGGTIGLISKLPFLAMCLWAPSFTASKFNNLKKLSNINLSKIKSTTDINLNKNFFKNYKINIKIIHGNLDNKVLFNNSVKLNKYFKNLKIYLVDGMNHGYDTKKEEKIVVYETISFIKENLKK